MLQNKMLCRGTGSGTSVICPAMGQDKMVSSDPRTGQPQTLYSFSTDQERTGRIFSIPREGYVGALWIVMLGGTFWQVFAGFLFEKL